LTQAIDLSVVIVVSKRNDEFAELVAAYSDAVSAARKRYEIVVVFDGEFDKTRTDLKLLLDQGLPVMIVQLTGPFGEATALSVGFEHISGSLVMTLPAYCQVDPSALTELINSYSDDDDMLVGRRWPRNDSAFNRLGTLLFHRLIKLIAGYKYRDLGCGVRLMPRQLTQDVPIYGDLHRFLPILANSRGYKIREVDLPQASQHPYLRVYRPGVYVRRLLDLIAVFFVVRFTKRPLRFFGLIGGTLSIVGGIALCWVVFQRLFGDIGLSGRPALLLSSLLVVVGVQLIALGLIGELIVFTHAGKLKEYSIRSLDDWQRKRNQ
jgi:glycosyltransferase involved in cell wall biosynthesis